MLQLARTVAVCVYEWIVTEWNKAFINLGGRVSEILPAVAIVLFLDCGGAGAGAIECCYAACVRVCVCVCLCLWCA